MSARFTASSTNVQAPGYPGWGIRLWNGNLSTLHLAPPLTSEFFGKSMLVLHKVITACPRCSRHPSRNEPRL
jgi:hypothetical protein